MQEWIVLAASVTFLFLLFGLRFFAFGDPGIAEFSGADSHKTLVVYGPPLGGRKSRPNLEKLLRASYPTADFIVPTYSHSWFSNLDPYDLASQIEDEIRKQFDQYQYEKIILFGYSTGGLLLRKVYVWGYGRDDDRPIRHDRHPWVDRVDRFVSLAAPNRGWPSDKPKNLGTLTYAIARLVGQFWLLTGTGRFIRSLMQGSPFVANMRVQWIDLFRAGDGASVERRPLIIHLIGDKDELVDRRDSMDIEAGSAAADVIIKTLEGLSHEQIARLVYGRDDKDGSQLSPAGEAIQAALVRAKNEFPPYWADKVTALQVDTNIKQLIFVVHGIRDESTWPAEVKRSIERKIGDRAAAIKIIPPLYKRFAMLPFLLYWDRQHNVRWFMDQYTQAKAMYPNLEAIDYVGHSNGTYIVASALQQYPVLKLRNIFFAGSVVPMGYNWESLIQSKRVTGKIWNVCADTDWVVAIFPQFFQQIADWRNIKSPEVGFLDIGSAGFRGFRTSIATEGVLTNLKYISGTHGEAFEPDRVDPIATFVAQDDAIDFNQVWKKTKHPPAWLQVLSNLSWLVWIAGLAVIAAAGALTLYYGGWIWLLVYVVGLVGLLSTI